MQRGDIMIRFALLAGLSSAAGLSLAIVPGWAQGSVAPQAVPIDVVPPHGARAASSAAQTERKLTVTERQAEQQRRLGEERFKRRDESMRKSLKSICSGC